MSILYQKARLLGRMFKGTGDGQNGTGDGTREGSEVDGAGSGWGGSSGKLGESNMAQAGAKNATGRSGPMSNQELADAGVSVNGLNPVNAGQTAEQMARAQKVNDALAFAAPIAMSMAVPGSGFAMTGGKAFANIMNGMNPLEAMGGIISGVTNNKLNELSGGAYGKAQMASGLMGYMGGPTLPNVGREVAGIIGGAGGGSSRGAASFGDPNTQQRGGEGGEGMAAAPSTPSTPSTPSGAAATPSTPAQDVDYSTLGGVDSAGWTKAAQKYLGAKT